MHGGEYAIRDGGARRVRADAALLVCCRGTGGLQCMWQPRRLVATPSSLDLACRPFGTEWPRHCSSLTQRTARP